MGHVGHVTWVFLNVEESQKFPNHHHSMGKPLVLHAAWPNIPGLWCMDGAPTALAWDLWSRMPLPSIDLHHFYPFWRKWMYLESIFLDSEVPWLRVFVSLDSQAPPCVFVASSRWHFQDISMQLPEQAKQFWAQWRWMLTQRVDHVGLDLKMLG